MPLGSMFTAVRLQFLMATFLRVRGAICMPQQFPE
jgi:hypothetical protein